VPELVAGAPERHCEALLALGQHALRAAALDAALAPAPGPEPQRQQHRERRAGPRPGALPPERIEPHVDLALGPVGFAREARAQAQPVVAGREVRIARIALARAGL